ncbi:hypothetical protein L1049_021282 [Liquidambar formosana]|uniref:C2 NT-type domain-containing protein n=1 Tax=Liquidambar formosana TaxID=63359 RepID=A0AAP0XB87_LIQFO
MFKSARWRSEKNKIKAVFKLQFQATQVPQSRRNTLTISLVPEDVGKPTVRLGKAAVQDGTCSWENPVYETVKFIRESKTGKINEKIYYFIVSTGSSKAGFLGEVSIDFADYVDATIPSTISLPLRASTSAAILHVSSLSLTLSLIHTHTQRHPHTHKCNDYDLSLTQKKKKFLTRDGNFSTTTSHTAEQNGSVRVSSGSSATLASRLDTIAGQNNTDHQGPTSFLVPLRQNSMPQKGTGNAITTTNHMHRRSNTDWSVDSTSEGSMADSTNTPEDNFTREGLQETSDGCTEKLKSEIVMLMRQAEVTELELQSLRRQIVKESKKGQDLSRQVVSLKEERNALKAECEQLKSLQKCIDDKEVSKRMQCKSEDSWVLLEEIRKELNYEKDLNSNLRLKLQRTQDSYSELVLVVRDLNGMLKQKNKEISHLSSKIETSDSAEQVQEKVSECKMNEDRDQLELEELVKEHADANEVNLLKQKIADLYGEIKFYREDREEVVMQMEQLALNYENSRKENHDSKLEQKETQEQMDMENERSGYLVTIKELESHVETLETEIKKQAQELSDSFNTIKGLETQVRSLEKELEKQAEGFEVDLEAMTHTKIEQEQRAIRAEETLRKTRLNNANTAERLQEEFRRLSVEMASKFDENEKLAMNALTEANELRQQKSILEEMLQKANEELGLVNDQYEVKLQEISNQIGLKEKQMEKMSLELTEKSKQLEYAKKHEEQKHNVFSMEIQMLRTEIERLTEEKNEISEKAEQKEKLRDEIEQMKTSIGDTEMLIQRWNQERDDLERKFSSARKEAEKLQEDLNNMRCLKDEKETMVGVLSAEVKSLRVQYNELKHSLSGEESEKEKLRKQIIQLKGDLQKKEEAIIRVEKKLMENNGSAVSDLTKMTLSNNKSAPLPRDSKQVANLKKKIRLLEEQIKLKEAAIENSTNSLIPKEQFQKEVRYSQDAAVNGGTPEQQQYTGENSLHSKMSTKAGMSIQNGIKSKVEICSEKEQKISTFHINEECNVKELITEVASLKERNKSMEGELNEMQERYSEISLKFAEVEGERQQLVMTVRNLKNGKKN